MVTKVATCLEKGELTCICGRDGCNEELTEEYEVGHTVTEGEITKEPTCTEEGIIVGTCEVCGAESVEGKIAALGHNLEVSAWEKTKPCVDAGRATWKCTREGCDYSITKNDVLLPHTVEDGNWTETEAATCIATGKREGPCKWCGTTVEEEIPAIGEHTEPEDMYWITVIEATCMKEGIEGAGCAVCGESITRAIPVDPNNHSFTNYVSNDDATCTEDGTKTAYCDYGCGKSNTIDDVGSAAHTVDKWSQQDDTYCCGTCTVCGNLVTRKHACHKVGDPVSATCIEGEYQLKECIICKGTIKSYTTSKDDVNPNNHTKTVEKEKDEATCTKAGHEAGTYCNDCEMWVSGETIDATGHTEPEDENAWTVETAATCKAIGTKKANCTVCGEEITKEIDIDPNNHSFTNYVSNNDATCTADGTKTATCDRCDETDTKTDVGTELGHSFGDWENNAAEGNHKRTCKNCDYYETEDHNMQEDESKRKEVSCTTEGHKEFICTGCGLVTGVDQTKLEHKLTEIDRVEAKCEEDGYIEAQCSMCEQTFKRLLVHTGHLIVKKQEIKATCTEAGSTEKVFCSKCGDVYKEEEEIPALGHDDKEIERENATCTEDGYVEYECNRCGDEHREVLEATGHKYTNYQPDGNATGESDGTKTAECDNGCGTKDTIPDEGSIKDLETSTSYKVVEKDGVKYIYVDPNTTVEKLLKNITSNKSLKVEDQNGKMLSNNDLVGTNATVRTKNENKDVYVIVILGDFNCDGKVTFDDIIKVNAVRINNNANELPKARFLAADVNNSGKIEFMDIIKINALRINNL